MRYRVTHQTRYEYSEAVTLCHNELRMTPRSGPGQRCERSAIDINPAPAYISDRTDHFGNQVHHFEVEQPHQALRVSVSSECETVREPELPYASPTWEEVRERLRDAPPPRDEPDLREFIF